MDGFSEYRWRGVNRSGQTVQGLLRAKNLTLAKVFLHQQGIEPKTLKPTSLFLRYFKRHRIQTAHIIYFTRSLSSLLNAQIPLVQAFELLASSEENLKLQKLLRTIQTDIQSGLSLADALQKHPKYFNALFCYMIQAGERSGTLTTLLKQLANQQDRQHKLKQKIKKSLSYPSAIVGIACIVTVGLLLFVVPQFQTLFESFQATLPVATLYLIQGAQLIQRYGIFLGLTGIFCLFAGRALYRSIYRVRYRTDQLLLKLPLIGPIIREVILARLTQSLATLLSAGLPIVDALTLCIHLPNNQQYIEAIEKVQAAVQEGQPLQYILESTGLFPVMMRQMVGMGEASGQLKTMLASLAQQQNEALQNKLEVLSSLFEPILMAVLGLWVGGLIIALYLPIFQLGAIIS